MTRWLVPAVATFAIALMAAPVWADESEEGGEPNYADQGIYIFMKVLTPSWTSTPSADPAECCVDWNTDSGFDAGIGWRESERIALELEFEWSTSGGDAGYGSWAFGVNGKYYFMTGRLQPWFVTGVNLLVTKLAPTATGAIRPTNYDWGFRHGIGIDYYLTEHIAATGEATFMWGVGGNWPYKYFTLGLGLQYKF
jgi:hypothetical protein